MTHENRAFELYGKGNIFQVGFRFGRVAFRSGIIYLYNSSTASIGNCPSGNGWPKVAPNRKAILRFDGNRHEDTRELIRWNRSPSHRIIVEASGPDRAREAVSKGCRSASRTKYSFSPSFRPAWFRFCCWGSTREP
jgi:hypothetical protein